MKKALFFICALAMSFATYAQQGQKAVGLNLGYTPSLEKGLKINNLGLAAKFQYGITDNLRSELVLGYDFKNKGVGLFSAAANVHYLFSVGEKLKVYPIAGVGYARLLFGGWGENLSDEEDYARNWGRGDDDDEGEDYSGSQNKFLVNAGLGAEYPINDKLSISAEVKYQYIKHFSRLPIALGVSYKF